ncbi:Gfo/Idh/MocA family oxidoreductase [Streptomyces sp. NPDC002205]|uniref:Gfo/Idh/MocA family oxidoreductase n=1 Tax=Streptomyces sp. NPDC002205 TaxID=3154411 RepID=UPI0033338B53
MTSISPHQGPIRVGVVGLSASGGWAAAAHVPALAGLDGYELRALSASSAESARVAAEKYAVALSLGSAEELARSEEVDLVVVTVRVPEHLELIRPALEVGKTVFSEWPLGADLGQAKEMADLAHRRGLLTAVGLQARSDPPLRVSAGPGRRGLQQPVTPAEQLPQDRRSPRVPRLSCRRPPVPADRCIP